jgi:hypothetical protein
MSRKTSFLVLGVAILLGCSSSPTVPSNSMHERSFNHPACTPGYCIAIGLQNNGKSFSCTADSGDWVDAGCNIKVPKDGKHREITWTIPAPYVFTQDGIALHSPDDLKDHEFEPQSRDDDHTYYWHHNHRKNGKTYKYDITIYDSKNNKIPLDPVIHNE